MEILIKERDIENAILKIIDFVNKKETVSNYIFKNLFGDKIDCEFDKLNMNLKIHKVDYRKVDFNFLLNNTGEKYLINYRDLKQFIIKNLSNYKDLKDIEKNIDYIYIDTLPNGEFNEVLLGDEIIKIFSNLKILNIDVIKNFEIMLII